MWISLLTCNEVADVAYLRSIDKRTLYTHWLCTCKVEHVTLTDELVGT